MENVKWASWNSKTKSMTDQCTVAFVIISNYVYNDNSYMINEIYISFLFRSHQQWQKKWQKKILQGCICPQKGL